MSPADTKRSPASTAVDRLTMARLSAADKWPSDIRELVGKLRGRAPPSTKSRGKLQELDIGCPALHAGSRDQGLDEVIADIRRAREIAEAIGGRIDEGTASSTARANIKNFQALTQKLLFAGTGGGWPARHRRQGREVVPRR